MRHANKVLVGIVAAILLVAAYVACYLTLGRTHIVVQTGKISDEPPIAIIRCYEHPGSDYLYKPAAMVESWLRGIPVNAGSNPKVFHEPY